MGDRREITRRTLMTAGAALAALAPGDVAAALPRRAESPERSLAAGTLRSARARVREIVATVRYEIATVSEGPSSEEAIFPQSGTIRFYYDKLDGYRQELRADSHLVIRVADPKLVVEARLEDDVVISLTEEVRPNPDTTSLFELLLPAPLDAPTMLAGEKWLGDWLCSGLVQGDRRYWVSEDPVVVRQADRFVDESTVADELIYEEYAEVAKGVYFPGLIRGKSFGSGGRIREERSYVVEELSLCSDFDRELISPAALLREYRHENG